MQAIPRGRAFLASLFALLGLGGFRRETHAVPVQQQALRAIGALKRTSNLQPRRHAKQAGNEEAS